MLVTNLPIWALVQCWWYTNLSRLVWQKFCFSWLQEWYLQRVFLFHCKLAFALLPSSPFILQLDGKQLQRATTKQRKEASETSASYLLQSTILQASQDKCWESLLENSRQTLQRNVERNQTYKDYEQKLCEVIIFYHQEYEETYWLTQQKSVGTSPGWPRTALQLQEDSRVSIGR